MCACARAVVRARARAGTRAGEQARRGRGRERRRTHTHTHTYVHAKSQPFLFFVAWRLAIAFFGLVLASRGLGPSRAANMSTSAPVLVGLMPTELVLRGGRLKEPTVLSRLRLEDGCAFAALWKSDPVLNRFLSGTRLSARPLARSSVFNMLAERRNAAYKEAVREATSSLQGDLQDDLADALGLDEEPAKPAAAKGGRRHRRVGKPVSVPRSVVLEIPRSGFVPWRPRVLLDKATCVVSMEATTENFQALFALVADELGSGSRPRAEAGRSVKPPRGQAGARSYWNAKEGQWVQKILQEDPVDTSAKPFRMRRFRVLKRRGSDEPPCGRGRGRGLAPATSSGLAPATSKKRRSRGPVPAKDAGSDDDCFHDDCLGGGADCMFEQ